MTEFEVMSKLNGIFAEIFRRDDLVLHAATTAADVPGWDSFKQIEIAVAVEDRFGIRLRTRDLERLRNVGDLASLVASKLQAG